MSGRPTTDDFTARARLFGGNRMKLGVMAFNCSHGSTITTVPEVWKLDWADTVTIAQAVDRSGMEALLPVGRWRGYGGPSDFNGTTFETFTWASALGALTKYVTVLSTCHVPLVHPLMVAKMSSTVDHVTNGRFALNIVCGWFKNEFDMFGAHMRPHDDRYKYAAECGRRSAAALCEVRRRAIVAIQQQNARTERKRRKLTLPLSVRQRPPRDGGVITFHLLCPRDDPPMLSRLNSIFSSPMPPMPG